MLFSFVLKGEVIPCKVTPFLFYKPNTMQKTAPNIMQLTHNTDVNASIIHFLRHNPLLFN